MKLGKTKPKALGGAPRTGRWTRDVPERTRLGGEHRGSLILLLIAGGVIVIVMIIFAVMASSRLDRGLLGQYTQARRRPDWVRARDLPRYVPDAFMTVVDTSAFQRLSPYGRQDRPRMTVDLVTQVQRLRGGVDDQAWRAFMVPLTEARLSRAQMVEYYLNRIYLGKAGDWRVYGVQHAAQEFFGKDARQLTLSEAATLAGMMLPPRLVNPQASPGAVGARRNEVLRRLLEGGRIDRAAFDGAMHEMLAFQPGIDYAPMTRPVGWGGEPEVIRLPPGSIPATDSASARPADPGGGQ
ncbi:transglycosylase domain-containing protein [Longimicrobium sp.]|uniref:transglycosylase domain-containing protein n=1 Tax=Longimicrobium sp. TaxID=2029185 RepID=UPI002CE06619|nr:transglycosylase domain-containing protein [Longimicrobium sp.]HSU16802.1 transglycosylase domain-containing protein [Longimicrobium sp.]